MMIIDLNYCTSSKYKFDPSRQYLVGIRIYAPFTEQNHRESPFASPPQNNHGQTNWI